VTVCEAGRAASRKSARTTFRPGEGQSGASCATVASGMSPVASGDARTVPPRRAGANYERRYLGLTPDPSQSDIGPNSPDFPDLIFENNGLGQARGNALETWKVGSIGDARGQGVKIARSPVRVFAGAQGETASARIERLPDRESISAIAIPMAAGGRNS
jgi:hypothetical protein